VNQAVKTQRLGAYAVVTRDASILLTRISAVGYPVGTWTLPGGGVDHGESPQQAMQRELFEEAGLTALDSWLVDVHDIHVVAPGRGGQFEDYHGVHLLYCARVAPDATPRVVEIGGTTDQVQWIDLDVLRAGRLATLPMVDHVVAHLDKFRPAG
jgi:8-oxo-dGTP diphosphatase